MNRHFSYQPIAAAVFLVAWVLTASPLYAQSEQDPNDPRTAPMPTFETDNTERALVVELFFNGPSNASLLSVDWADVPPPANVGNPPHYSVKVYNHEGLAQEFDIWHPLWKFEESEEGGERLVIEDSATTSIAFLLTGDLSWLELFSVEFDPDTDEEVNESLIVVDLTPAIVSFCISNPEHAECGGFDPPNSPPVVAADASVVNTDEGVEIAAGATFSDPDLEDTHAATIDWGDGTPVEPVAIVGDNSFSGIHVYADNGVYTVTFRVEDSAGNSHSATTEINVANQPPTVQAGDDQFVKLDDTVLLHATFHDAGTLDTHTATIDWGDGSDPEDGQVEEEPFGPPGNTSGADGTVSGSHVYTVAGDYTVTVTVIDDDGGVGFDSFIASVAPLDDPPDDPEDPEDPVDPEDPEDPDDPVGGEGCEVGFWRNRADTDRFPGAWPPTGYAPGNDLDTVFGAAPGSTGLSLLAGLDARGGGFNALARQAVAALLNAAHPDIGYDLTEDEVKAEFQEALASGDYRPTQILFEDLNKQGCPIDGK